MPYYGMVTNDGVPARIKCNRCNIVKNKDAFSKRAHQDLADRMHARLNFNASVTGCVSCMVCNPSRQVFELKCHFCDKIKDKDQFSANQRRQAEKACCWACRQEQEDMHPIEQELDDSAGSDASQDSYSDDDGITEITNSTNNMTFSRAGTYAAPGSSTAGTSGGVSLGGTSSEPSNAGRSATLTAATNPINTSSRSPMPQVAHSVASSRGVPSAPSFASSSSTTSRATTDRATQWGLPPSTRSVAGSSKPSRSTGRDTGGNKWAKIRAPQTTGFRKGRNNDPDDEDE